MRRSLSCCKSRGRNKNKDWNRNKNKDWNRNRDRDKDKDRYRYRRRDRSRSVNIKRGQFIRISNMNRMTITRVITPIRRKSYAILYKYCMKWAEYTNREIDSR